MTLDEFRARARGMVERMQALNCFWFFDDNQGGGSLTVLPPPVNGTAYFRLDGVPPGAWVCCASRTKCDVCGVDNFVVSYVKMRVSRDGTNDVHIDGALIIGGSWHWGMPHSMALVH